MKKKQFYIHSRNLLFLIGIIIFISSSTALGAGFALVEQSVSGLGNAYAGGAAAAEDATTIFYNPAGLTRLDGQEMILGIHIISPTAKFHNEGSTHITGAPLVGDDGGNGGVTVMLPNLYYSKKFSERLSMGIGINSPFGLSTNYDEGWVGRYHALESKVITVNMNPSIAYKITDQLSVGAGFSAQYLKARLSKAIDFGTLDAIGAFVPLGIPARALGLTPQSSDGFVSLEGDSWGMTYNLGLLFELSKKTRFGAAYRSRVEHTLRGDTDYKDVPAGLTPAPIFKDGEAEATITLPDSFSISAFHQFNSQWMIMADFTWTNWSLFDELVVNPDNPYQDNDVTVENWQDNYRYSVGVTYLPIRDLAIRAGTAYDTSAVKSKQYRTPRIPDSDRIWAALGVGYKLSKMFGFDIGYAHLFVNDPEIDKDPVDEDMLRGGLKGSYEAHVDIVSIQLNLMF
ncbi:MAG: outer membrane protein transport protein [Nitrospirae bacterium]|nr:outer membrane protein transport protein [Nitrospirota bacterium]